MIKNKSMFCIFCPQQSKIHVLSASPDLHGSLYLCLLPQARTSDLTYDVGVEVDYFEYILLRGFFLSWEKTVCFQCRLDRSTLPISPGSIATLKSSAPTWQNTCQRHCFDKNVNFDKNNVFSHLALKTIVNLVFENLAFENLVFENHCEFRCSPTWRTGTSSFAK